MAELIRRQGGRSDAELAAEIGVDRTVWYRLRTGQRRIGPSIIQRVRRAYPELEADCIAALVSLGGRNGAT